MVSDKLRKKWDDTDKDDMINRILDLGKLKGMYGTNGQKFMDKINDEFFIDKSYLAYQLQLYLDTNPFCHVFLMELTLV